MRRQHGVSTIRAIELHSHVENRRLYHAIESRPRIENHSCR